MKTKKQQDKNALKLGKSQQLELPIGITYLIPEEEPVRLMLEILYGIDFSKCEKETTTWSTQEKFAIGGNFS